MHAMQWRHTKAHTKEKKRECTQAEIERERETECMYTLHNAHAIERKMQFKLKERDRACNRHRENKNNKRQKNENECAAPTMY